MYLCLNCAYVINDLLTSNVICDVEYNDVEGARREESLVNTLTHLSKWKEIYNLRITFKLNFQKYPALHYTPKHHFII